MGQTAMIVDLRQFIPDPKHGVARRMADLLAWAAAHSPGRFLSHHEMAQLIGVGDARKVRRLIPRARALLTRHHGRALLASHGGARATTNPREMFGPQFISDLKRARRSVDWLREISASARAATRGDEDFRDSLRAFGKNIVVASNGLTHLVLELEAIGADITGLI